MCEWATLETLIGNREHTMYRLIKEHPNHLAIAGITGVICVDGSHTWCFYANSKNPLNTSRRKRVPLRQISRSCVKFVLQTCTLWLLLAAKKCRRCAGHRANLKRQQHLSFYAHKKRLGHKTTSQTSNTDTSYSYTSSHQTQTQTQRWSTGTINHQCFRML